ncbi:MAG: AAA family ATPase [Planctomycetota bacterium]|nr:AAA family ATPase [Planctomycetota bacterium]
MKKNVVRLAIVDPNDTSRSKLKNLLLGIDMVWLEAECSRYEFFTDVVLQASPDIALISLDANPEAGLALISQISSELPNCHILVISSSQEGSLILQAMRNGAREFLSCPLNLEDFLAALDRIQHTSSTARGGDGQVRSNQVITICGVGGGVGCTSLAINLACSLAQHEHNSVAIMDLDLALGDADVWLDIIPDYTIRDVAENISRLDYSLLKRSLTRHECGAFLLPRPVQLDDAHLITAEELRRVIALLKATFTHLVIDTSKAYGPLDYTAMEAADDILLVTQLDLPCLRNVVRLIQHFDMQESLAEKVKIIVNRIGLEDAQISMTKALETIGREVFAKLPNDYATMVQSRNNGEPLLMQSAKAKITKAVDQLAAALTHRPAEPEEAVAKKTRKSFLSMLRGS